MGRDWSWLGGGKKKPSSKSKKDINTTPPPPPPPSSSPAGNAATAAGCMSAVFNIFDLQHLQFPINHHHLHLPKGVDAPRNSLESTEVEEETPCSPARKDGNLNISMGFKIKTKPQARSSSSPSSSLAATESYSPSVKTPTLVARLMGLDLVPENYKSSPTPSSSSSSFDLKTTTRSSSHTNKHRHYSLQRNSVDGGTRSLPETPRISLGRRSVDCYEHKRSSLHLRDNNMSSEREPNVRLTRVKEMKIHEDKENRSPRDYARQIVMQLKENVTRRRRMGTDLTNKEQQQQQPRESHEPKKASKTTITTQNNTPSSPRLGLTTVSSPHTNNFPPKTQEPPPLKTQDKTRLQTVKEEPHGYKKQSKSVKKQDNFKSRLVKEEPFVKSPATSNNNNNDKSSLSINNLLSSKTVPSLHTIIKKKDSSSSSSSHHKQSNIKVDTSSSSQPSRNRVSSRNRATTELPSNQSQSLEYITRTLRRTGIDRETPISYAKWFSPSHPLDPSIFYFLEHFAISRPRNSPESLSLRCNRKLLFHLIDEILADILKPIIDSKPWIRRYPIRSLRGSELIGELSRRIERFPLAECLVLEDIDSLVAGDFPETTTETVFEEEGEGIVAEIERGIIEELVNETTTVCYDTWIGTAPFRGNGDVSGTWGGSRDGKDGSHHDSSALLCERRLRHPRG